MVEGNQQRNVKSPPIFRSYTFIYINIIFYYLYYIKYIIFFSRIKYKVKNRYEILVKV